MTRAQVQERSGTRLRFNESWVATHSEGRGVVTWTDTDWEELEREAAKEVWVASPEMSSFLDAEAALMKAGYRIVTARIFEEHPVWLFLLDYSKVSRISRKDELSRHFRDVMWQIGLSYSHKDAIVQVAGRNRVSFSILWQTPSSGLQREIAWERWRFQEHLDQLP